MIAESAQEQIGTRGLRRLCGGRDLRQVADLIEEAFAGEMDDAGRAALRELRLMSYWGAGDFSSYGHGYPSAPFTGFVWVEGGKIIGNVTLQRSDAEPYRWLVSNVAVRKQYRGRGIARALMTATLDEARRCAGRVMVLQVRSDNTPAIQLYRSLGFESGASTTYFKLEQVEPVEPVSLPGIRLRPRRPDEGLDIYRLVCAATSPDEWWDAPIRERDYHLSYSQRLVEMLDRLFGGPEYHRLVAEAQGRLVGFVTAQRAGWYGSHRLEMYVHPSWRGQLEEALVGQGLALLRRSPTRPTFTRQSCARPEGIAALKRHGFREIRTLVWMSLSLT